MRPKIDETDRRRERRPKDLVDHRKESLRIGYVEGFQIWLYDGWIVLRGIVEVQIRNPILLCPRSLAGDHDHPVVPVGIPARRELVVDGLDMEPNGLVLRLRRWIDRAIADTPVVRGVVIFQRAALLACQPCFSSISPDGAQGFAARRGRSKQ